MNSDVLLWVFLSAIGIVVLLGTLGAIFSGHRERQDRKAVSSGTVKRKRFRREKNEIMMVSINNTIMPMSSHTPARFSVLIEGIDSRNGQKKAVWHPVSEAQFNEIEVGDYWSAPK